jgi:hypothetical protein
VRDRRIVPPLQGHPTPHGLSVSDPRLGLDCIPLAGQIQYGVPGPRVDRSVKWNLHPNPNRRVETPAKSRQQPSLCEVAQRIAVGVRPDMQLETDGSRGPEPLLDTDTTELPSLDPPELATRDSNRSAGGILADAGVRSSKPDLAPNLVIEVPELVKGSVQTSVSSCHDGDGGPGRSPPDLPGVPNDLPSLRARPAQWVNRRNNALPVRAAVPRRAFRTTFDPPFGSADEPGVD